MLQRETKIDFREELAEGESILDFVNGEVAGEALELTDCKTEDVLYLIGQGTPVAASRAMEIPASDGVWPDKCAIS